MPLSISSCKLPRPRRDFCASMRCKASSCAILRCSFSRASATSGSTLTTQTPSWKSFQPASNKTAASTMIMGLFEEFSEIKESFSCCIRDCTNSCTCGQTMCSNRLSASGLPKTTLPKAPRFKLPSSWIKREPNSSASSFSTGLFGWYTSCANRSASVKVDWVNKSGQCNSQ